MVVGRLVLLFFCVSWPVLRAAAGTPPYRGEHYADRDYGYAYGFDFYDVFGDFGYAGPGAIEWHAQWLPRRAYSYENWGALASWFDDKRYISYEGALQAGAKTAAEMPGPRQARIKGTITATAVAPVGVLNRPHLLADIRTGQGGIVRVDLGPDTPGLRAVNVRAGRTTEVAGIVTRVREQDVVLAHWVRVDDAEAVVSQPVPFRLQGRIADWTDLNTARREQKHRVVLLETEEGRIAVIAGPSEQAEQAQMRKGHKLIVEGRLRSFEKTAYAVANRFRVERRR